VKQFEQFIKKAPQFTLLGDTWHDDQSIKNFIRSPEFMATLKRAGIKNIFVEQGRQYQNQVDDREKALAGIKNAAELDKRVEDVMARSKAQIPSFYKDHPELEPYERQQLKFVGDAMLNGIKIHYFDHDSDKDPERTGSVEGGVRDNAYRCYTDQFKNKDIRPADKADISPENYRSNFEGAARLRERGLHDDSFAQYIQTLAGKEKSVVIIGIDHLSHPSGLAAQLGRKATSLALYETSEKQHQDFAKKAERSGLDYLGEDHTKLATIPTYQITADKISLPQGEDAANAAKSKGEWKGPVCKDDKRPSSTVP
jgi:hypothetical protein